MCGTERERERCEKAEEVREVNREGCVENRDRSWNHSVSEEMKE